ncbi:MAG: ATP-binding protein [Deltaproteobacteria bacterium]|nr:ATP-binding protein [Deltaproteobacteria bacterium]
MDIKRYLQAHLTKDLQKKMVFLGGPRQCGKTTLAEHILRDFPYHADKKGLYLNWDDDDHRQRILKREWSDNDELVFFDELHKFHRWKNWIKGTYDTTRAKHRFLVTGSARLDTYKRGGDSLLGRYHYWRLHPLTLAESIKGISQGDYFKRLMTVGGFPEPFLDNNESESKRWRKERIERVIKDDIRDLEQLHNISALGLFLDALRRRVGGQIVFSNIEVDLQVSQKTLKRWLAIFENMYLVFAVRPFTKKLPRAIQKPPKVYFFDNADVMGDESQRFENLVATHLLKKIHFLEDSTGDSYELRYVRDKEGREVDFLILREDKPYMLIEAKLTDSTPHRALQYYAEKLTPNYAIQIVAYLKHPFNKGKLSVQSPFDELSKPLTL